MADKIESQGARMRNILTQSVPQTPVEALRTIVRHAEVQERAVKPEPVYHPVRLTAQSGEIIHPISKLPRQRFEVIPVSPLKPHVIRKPAHDNEGVILELIHNLGKLFERHESPPLAIDLNEIPSKDKKSVGILLAFDNAVREGTQVLRTGVLANMALGMTHSVIDARLSSKERPQLKRGLRNIRQTDTTLVWEEIDEKREHDLSPAPPSTFSIAVSLDAHGGNKTSSGGGYSSAEVEGSGISMSIGVTSSRNK